MSAEGGASSTAASTSSDSSSGIESKVILNVRF